MDVKHQSIKPPLSECSNCPLLKLPPELLCNIISQLTYDQIANLRPVCKQFDQTCSLLLNRGFHAAERYHKLYFKHVRARLPRRESERRNHYLSKHCDLLSAVETRLSLLSMTYVKYMDSNWCCFIPGKVLDEISRVMRIITSFDITSDGSQSASSRLNNEKIPRVRELLQELRDISSMAMEHFEERIVPILRSRMNAQVISSQSSHVTSLSFSPPIRIQGPACSNGDRRFIYSSLPRAVGTFSPSDSSSLDQSLSSLSKSFNQWKQAQEKEGQSLKNRLRLSEEQNVEMKRGIVQLRNLVAELQDKINTLANGNSPSAQSKPVDSADSSAISARETSQTQHPLPSEGIARSVAMKRRASSRLNTNPSKRTARNK